MNVSSLERWSCRMASGLAFFDRRRDVQWSLTWTLIVLTTCGSLATLYQRTRITTDPLVKVSCLVYLKSGSPTVSVNLKSWVRLMFVGVSSVKTVWRPIRPHVYGIVADDNGHLYSAIREMLSFMILVITTVNSPTSSDSRWVLILLILDPLP